MWYNYGAVDRWIYSWKSHLDEIITDKDWVIIVFDCIVMS